MLSQIFASLFILVISSSSISALSQYHETRIKREDDQCQRGQFNTPDAPTCCDMFMMFGNTREIWSKCNEGFHTHGPNQKHPLKARNTRSPHEGGNPPDDKTVQTMKECLAECMFNNTGLINNEGVLNEDALVQALNEDLAKNPKWTATGQTVFKKCFSTAKEANSQRNEQGCSPAAGEYMMCMGRELFLNCPTELWNASPECAEVKSKLEKCPNLFPPMGRKPHH